MGKKACLWIVRINIVELIILPRLSYKLNVISIQIQTTFKDLENSTIMCIWNQKTP